MIAVGGSFVTCLQGHSATAQIIPHSHNVISARSLVLMFAAHQYVAVLVSPVDVLLLGWRPVPNALGWQSAINAVNYLLHKLSG